MHALFSKKARPAFEPVNCIGHDGDPPQKSQVVSVGAGMQPLTDAEIASLGKNKCKEAIRARGGSCANSTSVEELRLKLQGLVRKGAPL